MNFYALHAKLALTTPRFLQPLMVVWSLCALFKRNLLVRLLEHIHGKEKYTK